MSDASKYTGFILAREAFKNDFSKFFHSQSSSWAEAFFHLFTAQFIRFRPKPIF
jgi:hypothetical protein